MANVYIRSGAAGTGTGADWTNAFTTVDAAFAAKAAGDNFWVSEDHAQSTAASAVLICPGTITSPCTLICVDHLGSVPPVSADLRTTASITTTGSNNIVFDGYCYTRGVTFNSGNLIIFPWSASSGNLVFDTCKIILSSGNSAGVFYLGLGSGNTSSKVTLQNTTIKCSHVDQGISLRGGEIKIIGGSIDATGTAPSQFILASSTQEGTLFCSGIDLSFLGTGTIVPSMSSGNSPEMVFANCKIGASTVLAAAPSIDGNIVFINVDSSGTNYLQTKQTYRGSQNIETTIVRSGGATNGTTAVSWKIITTANSNWNYPFVSMPMPIWNDTASSNVTITIYGIWGGGAVPNNDDIWIEVNYMGSSSTPIATINTANGKANFLASGSAQTSDSSTWGGSTTPFKMSVTLSAPQPQLKGPIYVNVMAAKASSTFYIDPKIELTNTSGFVPVRQYCDVPGVFVNESALISSSAATVLMGQACL